MESLDLDNFSMILTMAVALAMALTITKKDKFLKTLSPETSSLEKQFLCLYCKVNMLHNRARKISLSLFYFCPLPHFAQQSLFVCTVHCERSINNLSLEFRLSFARVYKTLAHVANKAPKVVSVASIAQSVRENFKLYTIRPKMTTAEENESNGCGGDSNNYSKTTTSCQPWRGLDIAAAATTKASAARPRTFFTSRRALAVLRDFWFLK